MKEIGNKKAELIRLYREWSGEEPREVYVFPSSGSNRKYYRFSGISNTAVGVVGEDPKENRAFLGFSKHFRKLGLSVPEIYAENEEHGIYLLEDLGDTSLFELITSENKEDPDPGIKKLYRLSIDELLRFQVEGGKDLDFSLCYPVREFSQQAMLWDLYYFKYYYLRPSGIAYDENLLETDFQQLTSFLNRAGKGFFTYRDFQSRNIFIRNGRPWFIDYQGGRRGPAQYDLASLLFQAKADLPYSFREEMLNYYMEKLGEKKSFDRKEFVEFYHGFVLHRTLQVLGAYGYRGFFEQKPHFIESARFALENIRWLLGNARLPILLPELTDNLGRLLAQTQEKEKPLGLTVDINSFSYLKFGYPKDVSGHGGGFVFDCRSLPNPGRHEEFKSLTGRDKPVIDFLLKEQSVTQFLHHTFRIVGQAVDNYMVRGFDHLSVNFGCTGGQHRSVFCAEKLYSYLRENYRIQVNLYHKMLE